MKRRTFLKSSMGAVVSFGLLRNQCSASQQVPDHLKSVTGGPVSKPSELLDSRYFNGLSDDSDIKQEAGLAELTRRLENI